MLLEKLMVHYHALLCQDEVSTAFIIAVDKRFIVGLPTNNAINKGELTDDPQTLFQYFNTGASLGRFQTNWCRTEGE